jgi:hypothetical protein
MPTANLNLKVTLAARPAPRNAAAKLRLTIDPLSKAITHQDLLVWWSGNPTQSQLSLQLDDEPEFSPAWSWENPGVTERAVVRIDGQFIPDDGVTHRLTVRIRELKDGVPWSPPAIVPIVGGVRRLPTAEQPAWCGATLIRQAGPDADALIEVQWRHHGAVKLMAKTTHSGMVVLGYADADESRFMVEGLGAKLKTASEPVMIGVCAIDGGQFGPPLWAARPIALNRHLAPQILEYNRDRLTKVALTHYALNTYLVAQLRADSADQRRERHVHRRNHAHAAAAQDQGHRETGRTGRARRLRTLRGALESGSHRAPRRIHARPRSGRRGAARTHADRRRRQGRCLRCASSCV